MPAWFFLENPYKVLLYHPLNLDKDADGQACGAAINQAAGV
jgi:hypothetical protein